jgi:magnesium transporter
MGNRHRKKRLAHSEDFSRHIPGSSPGTLVAVPDAPKTVIQVMAFGPDKIVEHVVSDVQQVRSFVGKWPVTWINVIGLGDISVINALGNIFDLHRLALEDVVSVHQRAKVELYKNCCFIVVRAIKSEAVYSSDQLSFFLGSNYVLSFQEKSGGYFEAVRDRIRHGTGRLRTAGPDYLTYALIDAAIDWYFPVLEKYGEALELLEDSVVARPNPECMHQIHDMRHGLMILRRAVWPLREAVNALMRDSIPLVTDETRVYLRDCYDHTVQIIDLLENYRDVASSLMEVYLSSISNRTNEIMKVLTIFAAIFIPLSLIAGIYGMNFDPQSSPWNMPELKWTLGYPFVLGLMALVAMVLLLYFRRKGWIGSVPDPSPKEGDS